MREPLWFEKSPCGCVTINCDRHLTVIIDRAEMAHYRETQADDEAADFPSSEPAPSAPAPEAER